MIALGVISVVRDGMAAVTLPDRAIQTGLLKRLDGAVFTDSDLGRNVVVAFWAEGYSNGVVLGVLE
jgi:hypothetical protein